MLALGLVQNLTSVTLLNPIIPQTVSKMRLKRTWQHSITLPDSSGMVCGGEKEGEGLVIVGEEVVDGF